jgi:hypothetical protein
MHYPAQTDALITVSLNSEEEATVKRLSFLFIAVITTLTLVALIGTSAASAAVLCKTAVHPCPSSEVLPTGTWNTYGINGGSSEENLYLETSNVTAPNYHCGYVLLGEQTTTEQSTPLPARGERFLSACGRGSSTTCSMSMSKSNDELFANFGSGAIVSGPLTLTANCEGVVCIWSGSYTGSAYEAEAGTFVETVEGSLTYSSGSGSFVCGGEKASLQTMPLYLATESYIESNPEP